MYLVTAGIVASSAILIALKENEQVARSPVERHSQEARDLGVAVLSEDDWLKLIGE